MFCDQTSTVAAIFFEHALLGFCRLYNYFYKN
jgi:hypothetical protein